MHFHDAYKCIVCLPSFIFAELHLTLILGQTKFRGELGLFWSLVPRVRFEALLKCIRSLRSFAGLVARDSLEGPLSWMQTYSVHLGKPPKCTRASGTPGYVLQDVHPRYCHCVTGYNSVPKHVQSTHGPPFGQRVHCEALPKCIRSLRSFAGLVARDSLEGPQTWMHTCSMHFGKPSKCTRVSGTPRYVLQDVHPRYCHESLCHWLQFCSKACSEHTWASFRSACAL